VTRLNLGIAAVALLGLASVCAAEEKKDTRAGNCQDAKSQMDYFCKEKNSASDTMVSLGTACTNAKKNVKAACEGVTEADQKYEFKESKK
jgi:hypothetical protein